MIRARIGTSWRIKQDGWWHMPGDVPILRSDDARVIDVDEQYVHLSLIRDGAAYGEKRIYHNFFQADFEPMPLSNPTDGATDNTPFHRLGLS